MSDRFCDTNVLLYLIGDDDAKATRAEQILRAGPTISVQVLNEFASVARRKARKEWPEVRDMLNLISVAAEVVPLTYEVHIVGMDVAQRHNFHIYDALIIAAALEAGCTTLYSEDMQHGQLIAGRLRIVDPFA